MCVKIKTGKVCVAMERSAWAANADAGFGCAAKNINIHSIQHPQPG